MPPAARSDNCEERGSRAGPRSIRPRREAIDDDSVCGEGAKGADLISPHQAAIAFDIGCEDRRELSFDGVRFQGSTPPGSSIARPDARSEGL